MMIDELGSLLRKPLAYESVLPVRGQGGTRWRPGSCSTKDVRGREAVMPESGLVIDLAECEDPFILQVA